MKLNVVYEILLALEYKVEVLSEDLRTAKNEEIKQYIRDSIECADVAHQIVWYNSKELQELFEKSERRKRNEGVGDK